jgi:hypothetical protein
MKSLCRAFLLCIALAAPAVMHAQEVINPPPIGGGTSYTRTVNGQVVEVTIVGPAQVDFTDVTATHVRGTVTRVDGSGSLCQATIRWVNQNVTILVSVGIGQPPQLFCIESGDIDRRSGPNTLE